MVFSDGSLGSGFKLKGYDISCATSSARNDFSNQMENLLNSVEEGTRLQVFYKLTDTVDSLISEHESLGKSAGDAYQKILSKRIEFLRENSEQGLYFKPEVYLFLRSSPHSFGKQKVFENRKDFQNLTEEQFSTHKEKFSRTIRQVESSLSQAGLSPNHLCEIEWFNLLFEHLNLDRFKKIGLPTLRVEDSLIASPLSEQLVLSDVQVKKDCLEIGETFFKAVTLKTLPEGMSYATMVDGFLKLPFHFWLTQNIVVHDQKKEIERLQVQRRLANSMAQGSKNISDLESESKLHHIEELLSELLEGSEKVVSADFSVVVWGSSQEEANEKADIVLKAFRGMNQSEGVVETLPCLDVFLSTLPGVCKGIRLKKMKTSNLIHLCPLYSYWEGNADPVCLLQNRDGALVKMNPFSSELRSWNGLCFGTSGGGKSFAMCQLMLMFYGHNPRPRVRWIDNGASSQGVVEVLGGEIIDLTIESNICVNVFDLETGHAEPGPAKIKLILAVLENIFKEDDKPGLPKRDKALLEEAIFEAYRLARGSIPTLSDFKRGLESHEDATMRQYAKTLYSWTGRTPYGRMLDGQTNVSVDKDFITIEMKSLDAYPDLQNVFLLLFTDHIKREASSDRKRPYLLIIDEAWKLFSTASGAAFTHEAYRTFRKFLGGIICISQTYSDTLATEELRKSIFPNTSFLYVLKQQVDDWNDFKEKLNLNEMELELIKSIRSEKGKFSEIFIRQNENRTLIRLVPDPLSYWICTSDANDKAKIERVQQENPDLSKLEVLLKIVDDSKKLAA